MRSAYKAHRVYVFVNNVAALVGFRFTSSSDRSRRVNYAWQQSKPNNLLGQRAIVTQHTSALLLCCIHEERENVLSSLNSQWRARNVLAQTFWQVKQCTPSLGKNCPDPR